MLKESSKWRHTLPSKVETKLKMSNKWRHTLPSEVETDVEMIHSDARRMCQLEDLEGEPVGVTCDEEDDDADQNDRRFFATTLKRLIKRH